MNESSCFNKLIKNGEELLSLFTEAKEHRFLFRLMRFGPSSNIVAARFILHHHPATWILVALLLLFLG